MKSNRERLLRWLFDGVWQLWIITGYPKCFKSCLFWIRLNSPQFASIRLIRRIEANWEMMFSEPQKREWTNSVIGLASRECIRNGWPSWNCRTSLPSQKYVIWIWSFFGKKNFFFSKNSWFFWKICRWENQENHIKKCFCDEIKKGAASQTHLGHLASSGRFLRTRVAPKSQFASQFASIRLIRRIEANWGELRNCSEIASILTFRMSKVGFAGIY